MLVNIIVAVVAFIAGLLVGRKNPSVATAAAVAVADAKSAAQSAAKKV
jgi:H+/Cl- antiporter ClcA